MRWHSCPHCGTELDRDHNAAKNILHRYQKEKQDGAGSVPHKPRRVRSAGGTVSKPLALAMGCFTALWKLDAREYVQKRIIGMYTLLPGMEGANASLLLEAIRDMEQQFSRSDFVRHLRRFRRILQRSETVSEQDKKIVEDYMDIHYDSLLDEDPEVQEREVRARVSELRQMVIEAVESEYPSLVELARERVVHIEKPDLLRQMVKLIFKASDESMARWVLSTF